MKAIVVTLAYWAWNVHAQAQTLYGQCGGTGYSGQSQCPAGASCQYNNPYYYQCLPGSAGSPSTTAANTPIPSTTVQTTASPPAAGGSQTLYGPCGGSGYAGATACAAGATCQSVNQYYYQCTPAAGGSPPSSAAPVSSSAPPPSPPVTLSKPITTSIVSSSTPPSATKVSWAGVNIAGCDFGQNTDGTVNTQNVQCPSSVGPTQMQHFVNDDHLNIFRIPVAWTYLVAGNLGSNLDSSFMATYDAIVQACLRTGARCIVDVHSYARWTNTGIIGQGGPSNAQFTSLWTQLATKYASSSNVVFGIMNEPYSLNMNTWAQTLQQVVTAIRNAGATTQWILLPGTDYSSAGSFVQNSAPALSTVTNPDGSFTNLYYDVHRYYDDGSGEYTYCQTDHVSDTYAPLATYLRQNRRMALLSETGGGNDQQCVTAVCSALSYLNANNDVYLGWVGWGAGSFSTNPNGNPGQPGYNLTESPMGTTDQLLVQQCIAGKFK